MGLSGSETHCYDLCYAARLTGYRRNVLPGGSFFFTVNLAQRRLWHGFGER